MYHSQPTSWPTSKSTLTGTIEAREVVVSCYKGRAAWDPPAWPVHLWRAVCSKPRKDFLEELTVILRWNNVSPQWETLTHRRETKSIDDKHVSSKRCDISAKKTPSFLRRNPSMVCGKLLAIYFINEIRYLTKNSHCISSNERFSIEAFLFSIEKIGISSQRYVISLEKCRHFLEGILGWLAANGWSYQSRRWWKAACAWPGRLGCPRIRSANAGGRQRGGRTEETVLRGVGGASWKPLPVWRRLLHQRDSNDLCVSVLTVSGHERSVPSFTQSYFDVEKCNQSYSKRCSRTSMRQISTTRTEAYRSLLKQVWSSKIRNFPKKNQIKQALVSFKKSKINGEKRYASASRYFSPTEQEFCNQLYLYVREPSSLSYGLLVTGSDSKLTNYLPI